MHAIQYIDPRHVPAFTVQCLDSDPFFWRRLPSFRQNLSLPLIYDVGHHTKCESESGPLSDTSARFPLGGVGGAGGKQHSPPELPRRLEMFSTHTVRYCSHQPIARNYTLRVTTGQPRSSVGSWRALTCGGDRLGLCSQSRYISRTLRPSPRMGVITALGFT